MKEILSEGDIIIDGGNSHYQDSIRRAASLKKKGIHFVDVGTSGGIWGLKEGYSLMIGEDKAVVEQLRQICEIWRHGSVVRSWLLDLTSEAFADDNDLSGIEGWVEDSGEGRLCNHGMAQFLSIKSFFYQGFCTEWPRQRDWSE